MRCPAVRRVAFGNVEALAASRVGLGDRFGVQAASRAEVVERARVVVLAVKPHQLDAAVAGLEFRAEQLVVSVMAGVSRGRIELCGHDVLSRSVTEMRALRGSVASMIFQQNREARMIGWTMTRS